MNESSIPGRPLLEVHAISKAFPNVQALADVSLEVSAGEVLALIGENGAGKSTLLRILNGDYQADSGEILLDGKLAKFASPREAHTAGIRVIYQEPELVPGLNVAENIYVGELPGRGHFVDWRRLNDEAYARLAEFGFEREISPTTLAEQLTPAQRQLVEILKALKQGVRVLALDEPMSSLSDEEAQRLFKIVQGLRGQGVGIIYVSHRLREVLRIAQRVAVLRDGKLMGVVPAAECCEDELVKLMVGRKLAEVVAREDNCRSDVVLSVEHLNAPGVHDVSFEVKCGEVVGFAGLVGAGRTELAKAIFGATKVTSGQVGVEGKPVSLHSPAQAMAAGMGYAGEDRKNESLFPILSVRENVSIAILERLRRLRFVDRKRENELVTSLVGKLRVKTPSLSQEVGKLSGGNQQIVVLARWLAREPRLLILDEPTRGIDVGAKAEIYQLVRQLAADGIGVIFISSELTEVLGVSDRIVVMQGGRITGEMPADGATEEAVLRLAMVDHLNGDATASAN